MKKTLILAAVYLAPLAAFAASSNFVPLTSLPITGALNSNGDMSSLFNNIYKICIGAAATIAVFQIARAGLTYMTAGDSEEKVSNARKLIQNSILGLVLILSPFIVFSIVNPDILNLHIGGKNGLSALTTLPTSSTSPSGAPSVPSICRSDTSFQWTNLQMNEVCSQAIKPPASGKGEWENADNSCCPASAPTTQTCCGFNPNYTPPATSGLLSQYGYSIAYQDTDPNTGKACVAYDTSNSFSTQADCLKQYNGKIAAAGNNYAISKSCTDSGTHSLTGPGAATLSKLPACSN